MNGVGSFALFLVIWWIVLFAVLPFSIRGQHEEGKPIPPGTDPGAPTTPHLLLKFFWTTLISLILFGLIWFFLLRDSSSFSG